MSLYFQLLKVTAIATADRVMTGAAKALNFETHVFH